MCKFKVGGYFEIIKLRMIMRRVFSTTHLHSSTSFLVLFCLVLINFFNETSIKFVLIKQDWIRMRATYLEPSHCHPYIKYYVICQIYMNFIIV